MRRLFIVVCSLGLASLDQPSFRVMAEPPAAAKPASPPKKPAPSDASKPSAGDKQTDDDIPPALTHYKGREIAQTMHYLGAPWLVRESRQREEDCETLLKALALKPGQIICDMGCGNGFYTLKLAKLVGEKGRVLAVDIQPEMLRLCPRGPRKRTSRTSSRSRGRWSIPSCPRASSI